MTKVLVVEDDPGILRTVADNLRFEQYEVVTATDGETAYALQQRERPDLVVLDLMLPRMSGLELCRKLRMDEVQVPVLMLTARGGEADRVRGLDLGGDDYVTKPFSVPELMARVRALLRRTSPAPGVPDTLTFGRAKVDFERYAAHLDGQLVEMTRKEFALLRFLASRRNAVVTRDEILNKVWGIDSYPVTRTVDNHIASLRAKLETNPAQPVHIQTVHGVGYRFVIGVLLAMVVSIAVAAQSARDLYQRGLVQEHANGDLQQAISLYAQAVKAAGKERALAAQALIRLAGAHEKLGSLKEAERTYGEILQTYPERRAEVALAQARLKALRRGPVTRAPELAADVELARRLATFLWSDVPDAPLLDAAQHGDLRDPIALNHQVVRMLRDRRSTAILDGFFATWLSLDKLKAAQPNPSVFPHVDLELLSAMAEETRLFVQSQVRGDRDAVELWTAPYTFVNERLARHYGLSGITGREFRRVSWPNANRAGLLGQAGPLTSHSMSGRTSPTARGTFVMKSYFGLHVPPPPANIPPLDERPGDSPKTMRERMVVHRTNPACASCHAMFDPIGFALENFDATGRWRATEGGARIVASGVLTDGTRFNGPAELRAALLKYRAEYYANVTQRLMAYALQRKGNSGRVYDYEMPAVRQIVRDASASGYRWSSLIAGIALSAPFQAKEMVP